VGGIGLGMCPGRLQSFRCTPDLDRAVVNIREPITTAATKTANAPLPTSPRRRTAGGVRTYPYHLARIHQLARREPVDPGLAGDAEGCCLVEAVGYLGDRC
jgi:hypothetical protein